MGDDPFGIVGRSYPDALAAFEAECQEPRGKIVDSLLQVPPAPADLLMAHDQGIVLGVTTSPTNA